MLARNTPRDRVFHQPRGWFFATREGIDMGPFPDKASAELEMVCYLRDMKFMDRARDNK